MIAASGIGGTVVIDPGTPVCRAGQTCSRPDSGDTIVFQRGTRPPVKVRTSVAGTFRVTLPPGLYRVTFPTRTTFKSRIPPIRVVKGIFTRVRLSIDIGIR